VARRGVDDVRTEGEGDEEITIEGTVDQERLLEAFDVVLLLHLSVVDTGGLDVGSVPAPEVVVVKVVELAVGEPEEGRSLPERRSRDSTR
jgi:hypothetical protein